jgi:hypothetical protein
MEDVQSEAKDCNNNFKNKQFYLNKQDLSIYFTTQGSPLLLKRWVEMSLYKGSHVLIASARS